ncbi:hypothetical protein Leryth_009361 [Lithospermum erythrorhizon]|nr:hypothetical protein Leryth_009361 [Lithospermum erythrorhizon]
MTTSLFPTHQPLYTQKFSLYDHKFNYFKNPNKPFNTQIIHSHNSTSSFNILHNNNNFLPNGYKKYSLYDHKLKKNKFFLNKMNFFSKYTKKVGALSIQKGFLDLNKSNGFLKYSIKMGSLSFNGFLDLNKDKVFWKKIGAFSSNGDKGQLRESSFGEFITSERVKVVAMLALALALCNADRVVMSVAIVPLSLANNWRQSFGGVVQSSFLWGYLISPVAGGTLVDFYGGKIVMAWGVALWSLATFLTPWAAETSLWALLAVRMLLGIAEGVALPCMNNMIAKWFPQTERSRAVGLAMAGFQLGSAIGLTLSPILMSQGGIFGPFVIFGLSGFLWLLVWISATSSTPERSRQISEYELQYIQKGDLVHSAVQKKIQKSKAIPPFRRLLSKLPTWSIIVANSMHSWVQAVQQKIVYCVYVSQHNKINDCIPPNMDLTENYI